MITGDRLDLVLLAAAGVLALSGYRRGLLRTVLAWVGFVVGAGLGRGFAPSVVQRVHPTSALGRSLVTTLVVIVSALVVEHFGASLAARVRPRRLDAVGGAALAVLSFLVFASVVGRDVAHVPEVRHSAVLSVVDHAVPSDAHLPSAL